MIAAIPSTDSVSYRLTEDLRNTAASSGAGGNRSTFDDTADDEMLLHKLGARGWGRVHYFRNNFETGWGENQQGRSLSPRALEAFLQVLKTIRFPESQKKPSVFLTDAGGIELCWEDADGRPVQVEFTRYEAEYFLGSGDKEGAVGYGEIGLLSDLLSA